MGKLGHRISIPLVASLLTPISAHFEILLCPVNYDLVKNQSASKIVSSCSIEIYVRSVACADAAVFCHTPGKGLSACDGLEGGVKLRRLHRKCIMLTYKLLAMADHCDHVLECPRAPARRRRSLTHAAHGSTGLEILQAPLLENRSIPKSRDSFDSCTLEDFRDGAGMVAAAEEELQELAEDHVGGEGLEGDEEQHIQGDAWADCVPRAKGWICRGNYGSV